MKLLATKVDHQYTCETPNLGTLCFEEFPPVDYCWYGYVRGEDDFIKKNFGKCCINNKEYQMCSVKNGVALLDYIDGFVFEHKIFSELERCLIENMDYWFCLAYECLMWRYDDLPGWCHSIIDIYLKNGYMHRFTIKADGYEDDVFVFEKTDLLLLCKRDIEEIVQCALSECLEEKLDQ